MSNRLYRLTLGIALLIFLYFDLRPALYGLIALLALEALTNLRLPNLVYRLRGRRDGDPQEGSLGIPFKVRTRFEAERAWRLIVGFFLLLSVVLFPHTLWFFPWFMGITIMGAGLSGVCPAYLALKWAGLK